MAATMRATRASLARSGVKASPAPQRCFTARPVQRVQRVQRLRPVAALEIDWSDPDTLIGAAGAAIGVLLGIGIPAFYVSRDERDDERLEELRALNRATKEATGEYMTKEEISAIRPPHWTDGKEFVDAD